MAAKKIWMLGTSPSGKGGIATVLEQYRSGGMFANGRIQFFATHDNNSSAGRWLPFLQCLLAMLPALFAGKVAAVHAHTSYGGSFWRKLLLSIPAFVFRVPVIVHLHGSKFMEFYDTGSVWRKYWIRLLFRHSFRVIALSEEWRQWVLTIEPTAATVVIFNSLPSLYGKSNAQAPSSTPTILFLGKIGERKGTSDLLKAFARIKASLPEARLVVGGDGEVGEFKATVTALKLDAIVQYVGWVNASQKAELLRDAWALALPSYQEGLPMAILEAMAHSKAIISCPVGGIPQAVEHGVNGLLAAPGDILALSEHLQLILSDSEAAKKMGQASRVVFERKFSNETNWEVLFSLYRSAGASATPN
jgi:glycosyltransferase involved in cell wall biosynthesis